MVRRRDWQSYLASTCVHVVVLASLWGLRMSLAASESVLIVEAVSSEEIADETPVVAESVVPLTTNVIESRNHPETASSQVAGNALDSGVSGTGGGFGRGHGPRMESVPKFGPTPVGRMRPWNSLGERADAQIADDIGGRGMKGVSDAPVGTYEQALSRIAEELIGILREEPVLVVWLFDRSESMTDDQAQIRAHFHEVYTEIGLNLPGQPVTKLKGKPIEPLHSAIVGFGEQVQSVTEKPTSDIKKLKSAIDALAQMPDHTGKENTSLAIQSCLDEYGGMAKRQKRRLVFVVVTDESGDDWGHLESLISHVQKNRSPVYILGREAIFGYPYAHMRWVDPVFGLNHWIQLNRGPETAFAECLQWDGLHGRWDAFSSGAGSYDLSRLATESGGIYFVLPGDEEMLSGAGANEKRRLEFLDRKEYQPDLGTRQQNDDDRSASRFRSTIWDVIKSLNPHLDSALNIQELYYPLESETFQEQARGEFQKAVRAMGMVNRAVKLLDDIAPARAVEASPRWRADYDLLRAQCLAYRVRLFQFLLAVDRHVKSAPAPKNAKNNCWNIVRCREMLPPDEVQVQQTGVNLKELAEQEKRARKLFQQVVTEHSGTPWARRAEFELNTGFGMKFVEDFRDPRYNQVGTTIKLPSL